MSLPASVYRRDQRNASSVRQAEEAHNRKQKPAIPDDIGKLEQERKAKLDAALTRTDEAVAEQLAAAKTSDETRARIQRDYSRYLAYAKNSPVFAREQVGAKTPASHEALNEKYSLGQLVEFAKCGHQYCIQADSDLQKQIDAHVEKTGNPAAEIYIVVRPDLDDDTWNRLEKRYPDLEFVPATSGCRFCAKWLAQARDAPPTAFDISPHDRVAEIYYACIGDCPWRLNREDRNKWYQVYGDIREYWVQENRRLLARDNFYNFMYGDYRLPLSFLEWAGVTSGKITLEQVAEQRDVDVKKLLRPRF